MAGHQWSPDEQKNRLGGGRCGQLPQGLSIPGWFNPRAPGAAVSGSADWSAWGRAGSCPGRTSGDAVAVAPQRRRSRDLLKITHRVDSGGLIPHRRYGYCYCYYYTISPL